MRDQHGTHIVLVRHAMPVIDPAAAPGTWSLADDARPTISRLAGAIRTTAADGIVASPEPKALGTGEVLAQALALPIHEDEAFREQGGAAIPWLSDEAFRTAVAAHFARPGEVVLGSESSQDAARRFADGVERARTRFTCPVIVSHGRVMCGYLAQVLGIDPLPVWTGLRLPDALLVDLGRRSLEQLEG